MKQKTVREIAGDIQYELFLAQQFKDRGAKLAELNMDVDTQAELLDLIMGILARDVGAEITMDTDFPVPRLPARQISEDDEQNQA